MTSTFRLIVVGASAAGIDGLKRVLSDLPPELPAAIAIVLHTHATSPRYMADILAKQTSLHVAYAAEGDELVPGHSIWRHQTPICWSGEPVILAFIQAPRSIFIGPP